MKISISFPPIQSDKGVPLLTQNRQFQWFKNPTFIYPVIPAYAATLLKANGYEVFWDDGIAEQLDYSDWLKRIIQEKPNLIAIETKTPVIKRHWQIIDELKLLSSQIGDWPLKIILMGDHVTALPLESMQNCQTDFAIAGGDFDFILLSIAGFLRGKGKLANGVWFRENNTIANTGLYKLNSHSLDELPMIDRELTKWRLYACKNGNFKQTPGAYVMNARDCWWGRCTFCSWTTMFPGQSYRVRSVNNTLDEIGALIELGIKEIMEDSGTLPIGQWLEEFCHGLIERGYNQKVKIDCNMRINAIKNPELWQLMKKAGFRLILFGLESANQKTLNRINKNLKVEEIISCLKMCKQAGLEPHITAMIGYPWETRKEALNTLNLAKYLFKKGIVDTLQATIIIPYPGTELYKYCQKNHLLNFTDYDRFDQREQVMESELTTQEAKKMAQNLYTSFFSARFMINKISQIRSLEDIKFFWRAGKKLFGHLTDFNP